MHVEAELSEEEVTELFEWFERTMRPIVEALKEGMMWLVETLGKVMENVK